MGRGGESDPSIRVVDAVLDHVRSKSVVEGNESERVGGGGL